MTGSTRVAGRADNRNIHSPLLPGGHLIAALFNRQVMTLADRGGASGKIGLRWADIAASAADSFVGETSPVPDDGDEPFIVERVARLDDVPQVAATASKHGLQNPDLIFVGARDGRAAVQAADAKFSIETARSKQVSIAVLEALLELGKVINPLIGDLPPEVDLLPGVFLSPDYPLTEMMLRGRYGIVRTTVTHREAVLLPVDPEGFFSPLEGSGLMPILAGVDKLPAKITESMMSGLYYFRLARAAVGCWLDAERPLLFMNDHVEVDEARILVEAATRAESASSAFDLILKWDGDVEAIRSQRTAVEKVAGLPIVSKQLRTWIEATSSQAKIESPSINQVRRRLGAWYRGQLRDQFGMMQPPVPDFGDQLRQLGNLSASLAPHLESETARIVRELATLRHSEPSDDDD